MTQQDTVNLLRECSAGAKMGAASIDDVTGYVKDTELLRILTGCKEKHMELEKETDTLLAKLHDSGKDPNPVAKGMSWVKTNLKLALENSDQAVAELITDGCNMGIKTLTGHLNQYQNADEQAKALVRKLIRAEEKLAEDIRPYL